MLDRPSDILIFLFVYIKIYRMNDEGTRPPSPFRGIKLPWGAVILILMLTAAVWIFFYLENMQLDSGSTAAVAFVFIVVVMLGRWFLMRGQRRRAPK
jgi:drug/metabolite transporter (DMT)-like permease